MIGRGRVLGAVRAVPVRLRLGARLIVDVVRGGVSSGHSHTVTRGAVKRKA
jgi:hypothetical protein